MGLCNAKGMKSAIQSINQSTNLLDYNGIWMIMDQTLNAMNRNRGVSGVCYVSVYRVYGCVV
jgi:hypothetical protein